VNAFLWVLQSLLAAAFLASAGMKLGMSQAALGAQLPWVASVPEWLPRFIGAAELIGALGLLLPSATGILPWLTPLSAAALALLMLSAVSLHLVRNEASVGIVAALLCAVCVFVAVGRTFGRS
jgi:hypothetical protein